MNFGKMLKKVQASHIFVIVVALALGYAIYNYSVGKASVVDKMGNNNNVSHNIMNPPESPDVHDTKNIASNGSVHPSLPLGENSGPASVSGINTSGMKKMPSCSSHEVADPSELLPKDENSEWAKLNPSGAGDLQNVNLLKSGYHIGINTINSSLRNANLQLRSEPPNPQMDVSPWHNTTISPDVNRKPLEIGCGGQ
jgi:hypothetical protein